VPALAPGPSSAVSLISRLEPTRATELFAEFAAAILVFVDASE